MQSNDKESGHTIPTHPPNPAARGDADKVADKPGQPVRSHDYNGPPPEGAEKSTGKPLDNVGGAGLGKPPGQ